MKETRNARIAKTFLGREDHGIMTAWLYLEWENGGQGFGGYGMDKHRYGIDFIAGVLDTLKVDSWEKLPGTYVRIEHEHVKVHRVGHITDERWFSPQELSDKLRAESPHAAE